ncbi:MAG TPA: hypothetical protein VFA70_10250 [Dehalococcoidia bacterium]|nr:hypothetical protein [Dehalococcoidia bacterium]
MRRPFMDMAAGFADRVDAGRRLAQELLHYREQLPIVLALPRGGVVVGYEVAQALHAPLDVIVARKLGAPGHRELGIGAIAPGGVEVLDTESVRMLGIPQAAIDPWRPRKRPRWSGGCAATAATGRRRSCAGAPSSSWTMAWRPV